jgi:hypothetical protein
LLRARMSGVFAEPLSTMAGPIFNWDIGNSCPHGPAVVS